MGTSIASAIEEMTKVTTENQQLKVQLEQKDKLLEELREEMKEARGIVEVFKPYMDIIEEEPKKNYLIHIYDSLLWKRITICAREACGTDGDKAPLFRHFIEKVLWAAFGSHWLLIKQQLFDRKDDTENA